MNLNIEKVLITGAAGFIGSMLSKKFLDNNFQVLGVDSINDYYSIELKKNRLKIKNKFQKPFKYFKTLNTAFASEQYCFSLSQEIIESQSRIELGLFLKKDFA